MPIEKQLDTFGPIPSRERSIRPSVKINKANKTNVVRTPTPTDYSGFVHVLTVKETKSVTMNIFRKIFFSF